MKRKILTYGILTYALISFLLLMVTRNYPSKNHYDCIVVLGNSPNPNSVPNPFLKLRLNEGIRLIQKSISDKLILTGTKKEGSLSEAEIMKNYCLDNGISESIIILEESALSTIENLVNSDLIMRRLNFEDALVVTSNHHIGRTKNYCKTLKLENFEVVGSENNLLTSLTIIPLTLIEKCKMLMKKADIDEF